MAWPVQLGAFLAVAVAGVFVERDKTVSKLNVLDRRARAAMS